MYVDLNSWDDLKVYQLLTQTVVPRPVAWVLSLNSDLKTYNLAPFSYFNIVTDAPPTFMLSISNKTNGEPKDTLTNICSGRPFTIHIASSSVAATVTQTSAQLDYGVSEVDLAALRVLHDLGKQSYPRLAIAKVAFSCKFSQSILVGREQQTLLLVEATDCFVADDIVDLSDNKIKISYEVLQPLARLGRNEYLIEGRVLDVPRPDYRPR